MVTDRLVPDRLRLRVSSRFNQTPTVLRRGSRGIPRRTRLPPWSSPTLPPPRCSYRSRRPGRRRLCCLPLSRVEMERRGSQHVEIPYQDKPNASKRLRRWPVTEQHGSVFVWNDPDGGPPPWAMPQHLESFPQFETNPDSYYEPFVMTAGPEPVHPQLVAENAPDSVHFQHVHPPRSRPWHSTGTLTDLSGSS